MDTRSISAAALCAAAALITAGCQRDEKPKSPIVIGVTVDQTGFAAAAGMPSIKAIEVWSKWINDKGGISGHPVELVIRDAKSDPAAGAEALRTLLNDPDVALIVHSSNDTGASDLIAKSTTPVINGMWDNDLAANPNVFPAATTDDWVAQGIGREGVKSNPKHPNGGFFYVPPNGTPTPLIRAGAKKAGGDLTYIAELPEGAPGDYTKQCRAAKAKEIGWIWLLLYPPTVAKVAEDCAKIGYKPTWLVTFPTDDELKVPALDGMMVVMPDALFSSAIPAAEEFRQAVGKYDPEQLKQPYFGQASMLAWTSMQLAAKAIEKSESKGDSITREEIYRGLYSLKDETLGGLAPPLTFTRGAAPTINCYFTAQIKNGKLVSLSDRPTC